MERSNEDIARFLYTYNLYNFYLFRRGALLLCHLHLSYLSRCLILSLSLSLFLKLSSILSTVAKLQWSGEKIRRHTHIAGAGVGGWRISYLDALKRWDMRKRNFSLQPESPRRHCVHSAKSGRHPPQKLLSRRHNSGAVCLLAPDVLFALQSAWIAVVIVVAQSASRAYIFLNQGTLISNAYFTRNIIQGKR